MEEEIMEQTMLNSENEQHEAEEKLIISAKMNEKALDLLMAIAKHFVISGEGELKQKAQEYVGLKEQYDGVGKVVEGTQPAGDYLNPIPYTNGMTVEVGKFYYTDDKDLPHEAMRNGVPAGFNDKEYFDFVE